MPGTCGLHNVAPWKLPEVPLEAAQEHIHEHAQGHGEGGERARWILGVALSSAIFAALAAVASLMAGHHINEALISQLESSDTWSQYQSNGIKSAVLSTKIDLLKAAGKEPSPKDLEKIAKYDEEKLKLDPEAREFAKRRDEHIEHHEGLAKSVTMIQVCIAIAAVAVLTNRKWFWWVSLCFGAVGVYFMVLGPVFLKVAGSRPRPGRRGSRAVRRGSPPR